MLADPPIQSVPLKNGQLINLRTIQRRDLTGIWYNFNETVREKIYLPVYTPVLHEWEKNTWYEELNRLDNICVVAEDSLSTTPGRIVAQCTIENLEWEAAEHVGVLGIIVQSGYRNMGLGYHVIEYAKILAKERGKKKINLSTFDTNERGVALYEKCGFYKVGCYSKQYLIEGEYVNEILMECFL